VIRLLDYIQPAGTSVHTLATPVAVAPGATIFESVRDGHFSGELEATSGEAEKKVSKKEDNAEEVKEKNAFSAWTAGTAVPLSKLPVAQAPVQVQPCLRAIQLSPFNPPPAHLRQRGHQLYLQVSILEGDVYTLVCTSRGWYASKSNVNNFDPAPRDASAAPTHSLIDLLHSLSPLFSERLFALPSLSSAAPALDPLSTVAIPQAEPAYPWLISTPKPDTTPDVLRTQLAYLHSGATVPEALDSARDWNEEIQGVKELPHSTMQERVFRERMAQKTWSEFTQASLRAVLAVARGDVIALNPNEPSRSHMWLTSNIFITKAIDSIDAYSHLGGDAAAHVSHAKDAEGVRLLNRLDVDGVNLLGHTVIDWQGERWVCQSVLPGIFSRNQAPPAAEEGDKKEDWVKVDSEDDDQPAANPLIIYGVDSEQTSTLHWDQATHEIMEKIAGHQRLAAHKVSAGGEEREFYASSEVKGLRGSDGRRYLLDLPRLNPVDVEFLEKDYAGKLAGPEKDVDAPTYLHRMALLRPELVELFWESELKRWARKIAEEQQAKKAAEKGEDAPKEGEEATKEGEEATKEEAKTEEAAIDPSTIATLKDFELRFNPDAFVDTPAEKGAEGFAPSKYTDESDPAIKAVRDASVFLRTIAVPAIALDVLTGAASGIMDGISLTRHMHARGINMRYLGHIAATIDQFSKGPEGEAREASGNLATLKDIVLHEMVYRASKHVLRRLVRELLPEQVPAAVSHFLNCLIGTGLNASPKAVFDRYDVGSTVEPEYVSVTPESLRKEIIAEGEARFRWKLDASFIAQGLRRPQMLRELAQRFAFQVVQRDYDFEASAEGAAANADSDKENRAATQTKDKKAKKAKAGVVAATKRTTTFEPSDILALVPVVRSTAPAVSVAEEIFEAGRSTINRGQVDMGLEFMLEGIQLYETIHTVIHPEVAAAYNQYSSTLHQLARIKIQQLSQQENADPEQPLGLDIATGLRLQRQAVIIAERTLGVYHPDTVGYYFQLAMLENLEGNSQASLRYFRHILLLWEVLYGPDHPEINTILSNAGIVLQAINENPLSITLLEESAQRTVKQFGDKHTQYGSVQHQLTQAHFLAGDFGKALESSTTAFEIFKASYGEEHAQTKEVGKNAELLKAVVDNVERQKAAQEQVRQQQLDRLAAAQTSAAAAPTPAATAGRKRVAMNGAQAQAAAAQVIAAAQAQAAAAAEGQEGSSIGEKAHLDVDELVKYIQGNAPSKAPRGGKNALRGKRRTGAKR
jgi:protein TIF31